VSEYLTQKIERKLSGEKELPETACIAVFWQDRLLMGKRRDSGKWTCPGGHLNPGEPPIRGVLRELHEEADVHARSATDLGYGEVGGKRVYCFKAVLTTQPMVTSEKDPDKEVSEWLWFPITEGLPEHVKNNLHHPKNILLKKVGLL
jgi:ADP-ribose pyrophosphatase YjhB (NUDIX family)